MEEFTTYLDIDCQQYHVTAIKELEIHEKINEHAYLKMTALIDEKYEFQDIFDTKAGDQISLSKNKGEGSSLFKGMVKNISIAHLQENYYLTIEAVSNTFLIDVVKKSRSFQNEEMKYADLVKKVLEDYPGCDFIDKAMKGESTGNFILQYQETDWEFLKRMASHFNVGIVTQTDCPKAKFTVGLPLGEDIGAIKGYNYHVVKDIERFLISSQNENKDLKELDVTEFHIETSQNFNIGDKATFQNISLIVKEKKIVMDKGILVHHYVLCPKNGLTTDKVYNDKIVGVSIKGQVLEVIKDSVKVQLEIDEEETKKAEAHPFQYSAMYTAEGSSGWYCMPEIDDTVLIYFPTKEEKDGIGVSSIRESDNDADKFSDPDVKYFRTKDGKELKFSPEEILITCCDGTDEDTGEKHITYIRLHAKNGIEIASTEPILLKSEENINLEAGSQILVAAKEEILFKCKTSQITVGDMIDIAGSEVKIN